MPLPYPVSILIPIYKTEQYIERCATSLFEQDFEKIQYIFIDDASPDRSIESLREVLKRYPQRQPHTRILTNPENLGLYQTRKRGTFEATGKYLLHIDSDDWLELDMISSLYQKAQETDSDIISCDFFLEERESTYYQGLARFKGVDKRLEVILQNHHYITVWNKLVKKELYQNVYQVLEFEGHLNMSEDWLLIAPLYHLTDKVCHLFRALYHYNRVNVQSLTLESYSDKHFGDHILASQKVYQFLKESDQQPYSKLFRSAIALPQIWQGFNLNKKLSSSLFHSFDINFSELWRERKLSLLQKAIYSFYLLHLPFVPDLLRKLRGVYYRHLLHPKPNSKTKASTF